MKWEIIIPLIMLNLFERIRCLSAFFDNWTLNIFPTLENIVVMIIDYNGGSINDVTTSVNRELYYLFYNVHTQPTLLMP
jgi:hypothetical protein